MAGYDISASRADSLAQSLNSAAGTVINFGEKAYVDGGWYGQTSTPVSNATAARNAGPSSAGADAPSFGAPQQGGALGLSNQQMLLIGGGVLVAAVLVVVLIKSKK